MSAEVEKHTVKFLTARVTHRLLLFIEHSKKKKNHKTQTTKNTKNHKPTQNQPLEEWIRKEHKQSNFARVAMIQQKTNNPEHEQKTSQNNHSTQEKTSNDKQGQR